MLGNMIFWWGLIFGVTSVAYNYHKDYFNFKFQPGGKYEY